MTEKKAFERYAENYCVEHVKDPSNNNTKYMRNHIWHEIMPLVLKVNPGIRKTIQSICLVTNVQQIPSILEFLSSNP